MMLKYLYVKPANSGVSKKIATQIKTLNELGIETEGIELEKLSVFKRIIPFRSSSVDWCKIDIKSADGLYIRYLFADYPFIKLLRCYRKAHPNGRVVLEMPTFPINKERHKNKLVVIRDKIYHRFLHKYVNHIVYEGNFEHESIYGIPSTRIVNGIDVDMLPMKKDTMVSKNIRLICVAYYNREYGMDRIIRGMISYYKCKDTEYDIILNLVGKGDELNAYKNLVEEGNISEKVVFSGYVTGEELDKQFNDSDIGIDALALHRKGLKVSSTLKTREYMARGIPFIYSSEMPELTERMKKYTLCFEQDDKEIDMNRVIAFYEDLSKEIGKAQNIRRIAKKTIDMRIVMKPVIELFQ